MNLLAPRRPRFAVAGGLLAALVATLSTTGALRGIDQYAVDHWMPWLHARHHPLLTFGGLTFLEAPRLEANLPTPWIGLWERINISVFLLWIVVLAVRLLRGAEATATATRGTAVARS